MNVNTLPEITQSLKNWEAIRQNPAQLTLYLKQGTYFNVSFPEGAEYDVVHAYPGIDNGWLTYFVIPAMYDKPTCVNIQDYVQICPIMPAPLGQEIPEPEAKQRMTNWDDDMEQWIKKQVLTPEGMYQAFAIPGDDFQSTDYHIFLALRTAVNATGYVADLIIDDESGLTNASAFFDTVRPVPPFKPYKKSAFYLLTLAEQ